MKQLIATLIGSRETPPNILSMAGNIGGALVMLGYEVWSGGVGGFDQAAEDGARNQSTNHAKDLKIYLPWDRFKTTDNSGNMRIRTISEPGCMLITDKKIVDEATAIAKAAHPAWHRLSSAGIGLMVRDTYQILGPDLETPTNFVVCYTRDGGATGGTGQAMRIAFDHNIPIYNLFFKEDQDALLQVLGVSK